MQKLCVSLIFGALALCLVTYYQRDYIGQQLDMYGRAIAEEALGAQHIVPEYEETVRQIATEMGVTEHIIIRKMNQKALLSFGYYNAITYFPTLFFCIPISNTPFLFVSTGFFEDLSLAEQRFLIGHEMVHIKERHTQYLNLCLLILFLGLLLCSVFVRKAFSLLIQKYCDMHYHALLINVVSCPLFFFCFLIPELVESAYRKHIEFEADYQSLSMLQSYDGCIKLLERWESEFKVPLHNNYWGLFADHPSTYERKICCLKLRHTSQELL
jgi:Zn-dependent protease with chaperone function